MSLVDVLMNAGGKDALSKIATNLGIDEGTAAKAGGELLPKLTDAMKQNAAADGGEGLKKAIEKGDHAKYLDEPERMGAAETKQDGNGILGHILGSKDVSRAVADTVANAVGIENTKVKEMLPMVATMAMGAISKGVGDSDSSISDAIGGLLKSDDASKLLGSLFG